VVVNPSDLRYTTDHEWIRILPDGSAEFGITDFAQSALGDIVFLQLPEAGRVMTAGESVAEVESVKSVSEIYAPVAGRVTQVNTELSSAPETINADPYSGGWLVRFIPDDPSAVDELLDAGAYEAVTTAG
jgi:glycine cleavage system H protein